MVRKVIGVPDSYVIDVDGHKYWRNKRDLTLDLPKANNVESEESDSDSHHNDQNHPMKDIVRPTLHPRPTIKFPRLPVQGTRHKDFQLWIYISLWIHAH